MILYHGSKSGINGMIKPDSRESCDFGKGFYMGDKEIQPKGLIAPYPHHIFYTLECNFDGLNIKEFGNDYESQIDWALFIAYNRKIEQFGKYEKLCDKYEKYNNTYDVIAGVIADDKMTQALNNFYEGILCDKGLIDALQYIKLGRQYVLKSEKACQKEHVNVIDERTLTDSEKKMIQAQNSNTYQQLEGMFRQIETKYRRAQNIMFFDEILEAWDRT